jgi:LAS superfamily LD-carboxypeptidase LdcB
MWMFLLSLVACTSPSEKALISSTQKDTATIMATTAPSAQDTLAPTFDLNYIMGKFDPAQHPDFVLIDPKYADRDGMYLHKQTYAAFEKMYQDALKNGVKLVIRSATRNFEAQKKIWENKWDGKTKVESNENLAETTPDPMTRALKILLYSSMPGTSRHHWGTDIDLNSFNNKYFDEGEGKKIYDWLTANAAKYGFCQPYTPKGDARPYGYEEERWHWSYLPIAQPLTKLAANSLTDNMIQGFKGAEMAMKIGVVKKYILGINLDCLPQ